MARESLRRTGFINTLNTTETRNSTEAQKSVRRAFSVFSWPFRGSVVSSGVHKTASRQTRRGISTVEYSVWMAVMVATLIGMSVYAMRALCGRWRVIGDSFGTGRQYEPNVTKVF